jgi:hypothetical protein
VIINEGRIVVDNDIAELTKERPLEEEYMRWVGGEQTGGEANVA